MSRFVPFCTVLDFSPGLVPEGDGALSIGLGRHTGLPLQLVSTKGHEGTRKWDFFKSVPFCAILSRFCLHPGPGTGGWRGIVHWAGQTHRSAPTMGGCLPPFPFFKSVFLWWGWVMRIGKGEVSGWDKSSRASEGSGERPRYRGRGDIQYGQDKPACLPLL